MKTAAGMCAWILFSLAGTREGSFEDISEIKHIPTGWQHRMCNVFVHSAKAWPVIEIFPCRVRMCVEVMHQPGSGKDPVLETFVVVTILRIGHQDAIKNRARQLRPLRCFRRLSVKRVGSDAKSRDGNEGVVLAVGNRAARLRLKIVGLQAGLLD